MILSYNSRFLAVVYPYEDCTVIDKKQICPDACSLVFSCAIHIKQPAPSYIEETSHSDPGLGLFM